MNHLSEITQRFVSLSDEERITEINSDKWIGYPKAKAILEKLEGLLTFPKILRMPNLLLIAPGGNGKTILLNRFCEAHKQIVTPETERGNIPVLNIQAPTKPDEHAFYISILRALNAPFIVSHKTTQLYNQVSAILRNVGVKILIIDEVHNILHGNYLTQRLFLNVIKYMANDLQIVIVGAGVKDALSAINTDEQLASRFRPVMLPKWKMDEEYLRLLNSFEALLPLKQPSALSARETATKILSMSDGIIGEISAILKLAATYAIKTKKENIDVQVLGKIDYVPPVNRH
jgi:hypothetical protein